MILGVVAMAIIAVLYFLLIRGWLWKSILFFGGWFGIRYLLLTYWTGSEKTALIFDQYNVCWATLVACVVCFMALLTTKDH